MSGTAWRAVLLTLVPAALCSGCSIRYPTDLSFHSARYADLDVGSHAGMRDRTKQHLIPVIEVHFRTSADLVQLRRDYAYMYADVNECDPALQIMKHGVSSVLYDKDKLDNLSYYWATTTLTPSNLNDYYFHIYIDRETDPTVNDKEKLFSINPKSPPQQICFYITGSTMLGSRYRSNDVAIPGAAIVQALRGIQIK
jgi:hypothetical protein